MTWKTLFLFCFAVACVFHSSRAGATDFIFSSFQCDPSSCEESTPIPVLQGTVFVSFTGTCTGGAVGSIDTFARAFVGAPVPCTTPFTPSARIVVTRTEFLDDFGCPFLVDDVTSNDDIIDPAGNTVFHKEITTGCDGTTPPAFVVGTIPC